MEDNNKLIKICVVCGDTATAKNFGALTCKSCKPFFRRNALKNEILKCNSGDNCLITRITRKSCRKCRLSKCFEVGMKKELIQSEVEKNIRKDLVEENRKKKQKCGDKHKLYENSRSFASNKLDENWFSPDFHSSQIIQIKETVDNDLKEDQISEIEGFLRISEVLRKSVNSYKHIIEFMSKSLTIARPVNHYDIHYTELEEYKLKELFQVFRPILSSLNKNVELLHINNMLEFSPTNNIFYEREITNLVKAMRNMNVFKDICENDSIALVKYSCIDILCLRAIQCYDFNNDFWILAMDQERAMLLKLDILKTLKNDVYITYKNYLYDIIKECDSDTVIIDLLTAIALFNPNRPNLINRDFVKVQQHFYLYLLQRYLTFKYRSKFELELKSTKLLNTLINAHILSELEKKYFVEDYQEQYGPLVKEVFDL